MDIKGNIAEVRTRIAHAALEAGRSPDDVLLIAVSKTYPAEDIKVALDYGITDIGENRVREICEKKPLLPEKTRIHLIGHLQTNKVKQALENACMIHSVDSLRLAKEISKVAVAKNITANVLMQINIADDEAKFGFAKEETDEAIAEISALPSVKLSGLMTVPAIETDEKVTQKYFSEMYKLFDKYKGKYGLTELSMGMSADYEIAVREGATMVRVGSKIFGARNYIV